MVSAAGNCASHASSVGVTEQVACSVSIKLRARRGRILRKQLGHGNVAVVRIADIAQQVGVGEFLGFDHHVQSFGAVVAILRQRKSFHHVEHLKRRDSLSVGRQFRDGPAAIVGGDRLDPLGLEVGQVGGRPFNAIFLGFADQRLRRWTFVETIASMRCDQAQRGCQVAIAENFANFRRAAVRQIGFFRAFVRRKLFVEPCHAAPMISVTGNPFSA